VALDIGSLPISFQTRAHKVKSRPLGGPRILWLYNFSRDETVGSQRTRTNYNDVPWDNKPFTTTLMGADMQGAAGKLAEPGDPPHAAQMFSFGTLSAPERKFDLRGILGFQFVIGAGTRLTITAQAEAELSIDSCAATSECLAVAGVSFETGSFPERESIALFAHVLPGEEQRSVSMHQTKTLTWQEEPPPGDNPLETGFGERVLTRGEEFTPPIPEPATVMLMLLGLVFCAYARKDEASWSRGPSPRESTTHLMMSPRAIGHGGSRPAVEPET
jgi:hypothetical protein